VPKTFKIIKKHITRYFKVKCFELKELRINKLIKIKVNKKQIGSDRLANAIGSMNNKDNFIILDFGTATTFDVLFKNVYHGGIISPGIRLSLNTLITNASLIPNLNLKKIDKVIASNTVNAVRSGFFWGYRGLIDNIVNLIKKETRKSFKIIITGGFSHLFSKFNNMKVTINRDITIKGLIKASNLIK
jgi:type III pantothenate kinase